MTSRKDFNTGYSSGTASSGMFRAEVVEAGTQYLKVRVPRLGVQGVFENVPYFGIKPAVGETIIVGLLEGNASSPVAITPSSYDAALNLASGDITGVTAGTGISGGGTSGDVSVAFAPSELSSVTVATDDKVVIADTSDSDNPKHVTAQSIADLAPQGDITGVTAGLGIGGGGTTGTVEVTFAPSELSSVTVATDDKVVIADTSDSDNPKHVTAQSIANLALVSPAGSDHQVQFNDNGSFGADANFTYDGSNLTAKVPFTVGVNDTGHDVKFFGATDGKYMEWDESDDALKVSGTIYSSDGTDTSPSFSFSGDVDTGMYLYGANQLGFTVGGDSIAYFKEGAGSGYGGLIINDTSETIADGGIRIGQWYTSTYSGIFMDGHTGNEYMMISNGTSNFVSCGAGGSLYLRGAENNSTTSIQIDAASDEITVGTSGTKTAFAGFIEVLNEIQCGSGTVSDPSYTFDSDGDTGIYHTTNVLRITTGGSQRALFSSAGFYAIKSTISTGFTYATWNSSTGYLSSTSSSERYKENIQNMPKSEWEKVYQLQARTFDWKDDGSVELSHLGKSDFGLIAEEVNDVLPMYVSWDRESHLDSDDELGVGNESALVIQGLDYGKITTYLIEVVKDLKTRLEALES